MFQTEVVEKVKTHFVFHNLFFRHSCRSWNNVQKYGSARRATLDAEKLWFACPTTKARIQTLVIFNTYVFYTSTMVKWTHLSVALYLHSSFPPDSRCRLRTFHFVIRCSNHWTVYSEYVLNFGEKPLGKRSLGRVRSWRKCCVEWDLSEINCEDKR
jgi:hypothetical protein